MFMLPAEVSLSKFLHKPCCLPDKRWLCLYQAAHLTGMPKVNHHHPDDIMRKNACGMTKTRPGLTFHPAADETDPRVHVFVSFPSYLHNVNPTRLSLRSCTCAGTRLVRPPCPWSQSESRPPLVPPTQTRCFVRSNTGRIAGWKVATLTRRTSCTSAAPSPPALLD